MSIPIKHIFSTDLDPNSNDWWSKDKVDKLNLNFSLLSGGGIPGPLGSLGEDGNFGEDGPQGATGPQGYQGATGDSGPQGISRWTANNSDNFLTLHPNFQGISEEEYQPIRVGIGQTDVEQNAISYQGPLTILHNHDHNLSNLIINSPGALDFHFKLSPKSQESNFKKLEIGDITNSSFELKLQYDLDTMDYFLHNDPKNNDYLLEASRVSSTNNNINLKFRSVNTKLGVSTSNITANSNFKYTNNSFENLENKVLVSLDADGNTTWSNKTNVFGTLPIGSIISITTDWFNNTNFYLEYEENQTGELEIIYGKGRIGGPFEGWYICNGQKWTDGIIQYDVPNLNSFDFNIDSNGGGQDAKDPSDIDNTPIIIGGYNLEMESMYDTGVYTSKFITPSNTTTDQITLNTGGNFDISRNIHIIYLKEINYFWKTGDITPPQLDPIELKGPFNNYYDACTATQSQSYKWTGGLTNWADGDMTNIILYNEEESARAIAGWYSKDGISRRWTGSVFSLRETCPTLEIINLTFKSNVTELNGDLTSNDEYIINSQNFKDASSLLLVNSNAPAGWYRENGLNGYRRYWSGTEFIGGSFKLPYIYSSGVIGASSTTNSACASSDPTPIYYATFESSTPSDSITELHKINATNGIILVHFDWQGTIANGENPLVKIKDLNANGVNVPYTTLTDTADADFGIDTYSSIITIDSTINDIYKCIPYELSNTNDGNSYKLEDPYTSIISKITVHYLPATVKFTAYGGSQSGDFVEGKLKIYLPNGNQELTLSAGEDEIDNTSYTFQDDEIGEFSYEMRVTNRSGNRYYLRIE